MDNESLRILIVGVLAAGSGAVLKPVMAQVVKWREEEGKAISPRTKRRLALFLTFAVPTVLYLGFVVLLVGQPYNAAEHIGYMLASFTANQVLHGETELPTGAEVRAQARLAQYGLVEPPGEPVQAVVEDFDHD